MLDGLICCPGELLMRPEDSIERADASTLTGFAMDSEIVWAEAILALAGGTTTPAAPDWPHY